MAKPPPKQTQEKLKDDDNSNSAPASVDVREEPGYRMTLEDRAKLQKQLDEIAAIGNEVKKDTLQVETETAKIKEDQR